MLKLNLQDRDKEAAITAVPSAVEAVITAMIANVGLRLRHATVDITSQRRAAIWPHLNRALHRLCHSDTVRATSQLFGDDLASSLRDLQELDKLHASLQPSTSRFAGNFSQAPFLGPDQGKGPERVKYQWS
ncbi:hypothetical protein PoB_002578900 [Plakobranchus ocellatus]|uniref:RUN domain-containing protein n=1 Tax=Plakobranchus ocellatus TaxID=259542 RepID=A0AAV3ZVE1_9GAST|nr:hypothetical protein PoB_002578900 [Plakobranchus ocellatus]